MWTLRFTVLLWVYGVGHPLDDFVGLVFMQIQEKSLKNNTEK
jgi:hypothetical protein